MAYPLSRGMRLRNDIEANGTLAQLRQMRRKWQHHRRTLPPGHPDEYAYEDICQTKG